MQKKMIQENSVWMKLISSAEKAKPCPYIRNGKCAAMKTWETFTWQRNFSISSYCQLADHPITILLPNLLSSHLVLID